jgi:hypothetical protein
MRGQGGLRKIQVLRRHLRQYRMHADQDARRECLRSFMMGVPIGSIANEARQRQSSAAVIPHRAPFWDYRALRCERAMVKPP